MSETFVFDDMLESELSKAFGGMERLDTFFPFDPCLLRNCDRFTISSFNNFTWEYSPSVKIAHYVGGTPSGIELVLYASELQGAVLGTTLGATTLVSGYSAAYL